MKTWTEHINDLSGIILNTRDFCGDELEAVREYLAEHRFERGSINYAIITERAMTKADAEWRRCQSAAGVRR